MKKDTLIGRAGSHPERQSGFPNPPVYHGSTVLFESLAAFREAQKNRYREVFYGRFGTPTSFALEDAMCALEGGHASVAVGSGLAAITVSMFAFLKAGDHLLVSDTVYGRTRDLCTKMLPDLGVGITFYDPLVGAGIAELMRPETKVVFTESPGSYTFEVQDIPAIVGAVRERAGAGCLVMLDNTWATPHFYRPLEHGVDISISSATKYIVGHSDAMLGLITTASEAHFLAIRACAGQLGTAAGADACYLGLRGIRTLGLRLARHQQNATVVARWLQGRPEVSRVIWPGLPDDPGHAIWRRDFDGASGLMSIVLDRSYPEDAIAACVDGFEYFGIGVSWGGYESLVLPVVPEHLRSATEWTEPSPILRLHVGLEDPDDLIADLEAGLARLGSKP